MAELSYLDALDQARERAAALADELPADFVAKPGATRMLRRGDEWIGITRVEYSLGAVRVDQPDQPGDPASGGRGS